MTAELSKEAPRVNVMHDGTGTQRGRRRLKRKQMGLDMVEFVQACVFHYVHAALTVYEVLAKCRDGRWSLSIGF